LIAPSAAKAAAHYDEDTAAMIQVVCDHCRLVMLFAAPPILGCEA
jgi:hypothetical protein